MVSTNSSATTSPQFKLPPTRNISLPYQVFFCVVALGGSDRILMKSTNRIRTWQWKSHEIPIVRKIHPHSMSIFHCSARKLGGGSFLGTLEGTKWSPTIVINGWTWCTYQWPKKMPKIYVLPSLKLTYIAPENGCLENFLVSFWDRFRPTF